MKPYLLALTALFCAPVVAHANDSKAATTPAPRHNTTQKIVVHLSDSESHNALHSAFMAIGLATGLEKMGAQVTLMLDSSAPNFAKTSWSRKSRPAMPGMPMAKIRTLGDAFGDFVAAGGQIVMCPHCSLTCGVQKGATIPGAKLGAEGELVKLVYGADKVLDY